MSSDAHLLPDNATPQEKAISQSIARAGSVTNPVGQLWSPYDCPAAVLPWLAWALSVDDWQESWTDQQKRDAVAASIEVHRRKGTIGALKRALQALGYEVTIDEETGQAYTFRLRVDASELGIDGPNVYDEVERIANSAKNVRSHLLGVDGFLRTEGMPDVGVATVDGLNTRVLPGYAAVLESLGDFSVLLAEQTGDWVHIWPEPPADQSASGMVQMGGAFTIEVEITLG